VSGPNVLGIVLASTDSVTDGVTTGSRKNASPSLLVAWQRELPNRFVQLRQSHRSTVTDVTDVSQLTVVATSTRPDSTTSQWRRNEFESGGGAPVQSKSGGTDPAPSAGKIFGRAPPLFGSKHTISRFCERFHGGQYTVWSVSCMLFSYSRCSPCAAICKSGGHVPRAP